ncbi:MAG TPA: TldD/PmbA family protein [Elusimicrobia bacterium]|jgi:PmbA protein|nr:TldD/PmbA family protein [Elusimicrobiota bacterium]
MELIPIGEEYIKQLKKEKLEGEIFLASGQGLQFSFSEGNLEDFRLAEESGLGLRILTEKKIGFASLNSIVFNDNLIKKAKDNALNSTEDKYYSLPEGMKNYPKVPFLNLKDGHLQEMSLEKKIQKVQEQEKLALNRDERIKKVLRAGYSENYGANVILNTKGISGEYEGSYCSFALTVLTEENNEIQIGMEMQDCRFYEDLDFEKVSQQAVEKALGLLGRKRIKSGRYTAVFDPWVSCEFLDLLAESFCADSVQKGKSYLKDRIGEKIGSSLLNLVDDGLLPKGIGSAPYDGEGVPTKKKILTENGILENFLYDTYTATKEGVKSTGNAGRNSFESIPEPDTTNFYLLPGEKNKEKIIKEIGNGIYIIEVMGLHTADPVSGDFSVGISGRYIKDGELSFPLQGMTMAGNIWQLMNSIIALGNDLKFYGSIGAPTIVFSEVTFGGE